MPQDPLPQKILEILVTLADKGGPAFKTPKEQADALQVTTAAVQILDAWAISRGLVKGPPTPAERRRLVAGRLLAEKLGVSDHITPHRDENGWSAGRYEGRQATFAAVNDHEVDAAIAAEDANGR